MVYSRRVCAAGRTITRQDPHRDCDWTTPCPEPVALVIEMIDAEFALCEAHSQAVAADLDQWL